MASRKTDAFLVALTIHGFTLGHAVVAGVLGPFAGATLTPMTAAMIGAIGWICGARVTAKFAVKKAGLFAAELLGVAGAELLLGLIPVIGNGANAVTSAAITELLGWAIYRMFVDGLDDDDDMDVKELLSKAKKDRQKNKKLMKELKDTMNTMSYRDKAKYRKYMKIVRDKNASEERRRDALFNAKMLMEKYGLVV